MQNLEALYTDYHDAVYRFARRLGADERLSEDITQETFLRAARHLNSFRQESSPLTWLCSIAKRLLYDHKAKLSREEPLLDTQGRAPDFADMLAEKDRAMLALKQLHLLKDPYKEVFTLRTFCDMSHKDIGDVFNKSEAWARVTYYRARALLNDALRQQT